MTTRLGGKTGGRRRGSIDRGERQLVTAEMAADLLTVYKKLGGVKWLLEFAKANPAEFLKQGLSRLFPAPAKDDESGSTFNTQVNIGDMSDKDAAVRVAFALSKAVYGYDPSLTVEHAPPVVERVPEEYVSVPRWRPPEDALDMLPPEPVEDPERMAWAAGLSMKPTERADHLLVKETKEANISNYVGSSSEQGGFVERQSSGGKPTVNQIYNRMRSRRNELL